MSKTQESTSRFSIKPADMHLEEDDLTRAVRNLLFILCKELGVIWLIKKVFRLELKRHYMLRDVYPEFFYNTEDRS